MDRYDLAKNLARACAEMEGFFVTEEQARERGIKWPTAAQRNNNPGNVMDLGHYRKTKKFKLAEYVTLEQGWREAEAWWLRRIRDGYTLRKAIHRYAPKGHGGNDPDKYVTFVAEKVKIDPDTNMALIVAGGAA